MDYAQKIISLATVLVLLLFLQPVKAQSNIDVNRMNRDINIMENVLQELFKTRWETRHHDVRIHAGSFSFGDRNDIRGTYLPGYGVIFTISGGPRGFVSISTEEEDGMAYSFQYGENENGEKVTQESVTNKIVEFLRDYGSTIGQLSSDDKVMVIYNRNNADRGIAVFRTSNNEEIKQNSIPTISVVATKSDLQAYRSGNISADEFRNRLDISTAEASGKKHKDLRVMANIFETAFKNSEEQSFGISGSVDYLKLDNFGALFSFDARYASSSRWDFSDIHESIEVIKKDLEEARVELEKEIREEVKDSVRTAKRKEIEKKRGQAKKEVLKAYDQFLADLKEYIVDYGRTLSSVNSDQHVLVSVTLRSRYDEIPERIDMQIQKSALASWDQGDMNRDEVINQIQIREY